MLRALKRAAAAVALAALFAGTAGVLVAADRREPPATLAVAGGQTGDRPGADGGQSRDRRGTDGGQTPGRVAKRPVAEVRWRRSTSLGLHWAGRLAGGVRLPAEGRTFFTWDPIMRRSPNRAWRRWANDRLVRTLLEVLDAFAAAHPEAPRVGVGDLSRPNGGDFGPRYGLPGHVSHQNGLDADLYYPRLDRRERAPDRPAQINRPLAQELVDRFVAAGAVRVFVGPNTGLRGPPRVVQALAHHDNHLHLRLPLDASRQRPRSFRTAEPRSVTLLGRTTRGRPVRAFRLGNPAGQRRLLVVGCIHGTECAGMAIARRLIDVRRSLAADLWVVQNLNPDGFALRVRQNARGVDLNRNFGSEWRRIGARGDPQHSGRVRSPSPRRAWRAT